MSINIIRMMLCWTCPSGIYFCGIPSTRLLTVYCGFCCFREFLQGALATGCKVRTLSIEDAYTREMLAIEVDTSLPALRVVIVLEKLRHGPVGVGVELEPDARAGQVVAVQCVRDLKCLPESDGVSRRQSAHGHVQPNAVVQVHRLAVGQVSAVHLPRASGQLYQAQQPPHHCARLSRQERRSPFSLAAGQARSEPGNGERCPKKKNEGEIAATHVQRGIHGGSNRPL
jgi:hypothetical protein